MKGRRYARMSSSSTTTTTKKTDPRSSCLLLDDTDDDDDDEEDEEEAAFHRNVARSPRKKRLKRVILDDDDFSDDDSDDDDESDDRIDVSRRSCAGHHAFNQRTTSRRVEISKKTSPASSNTTTMEFVLPDQSSSSSDEGDHQESQDQDRDDESITVLQYDKVRKRLLADETKARPRPSRNPSPDRPTRVARPPLRKTNTRGVASRRYSRRSGAEKLPVSCECADGRSSSSSSDDDEELIRQVGPSSPRNSSVVDGERGKSNGYSKAASPVDLCDSDSEEDYKFKHRSRRDRRVSSRESSKSPPLIASSVRRRNPYDNFQIQRNPTDDNDDEDENDNIECWGKHDSCPSLNPLDQYESHPRRVTDYPTPKSASREVMELMMTHATNYADIGDSPSAKNPGGAQAQRSFTESLHDGPGPAEVTTPSALSRPTEWTSLRTERRRRLRNAANQNSNYVAGIALRSSRNAAQPRPSTTTTKMTTTTTTTTTSPPLRQHQQKRPTLSSSFHQASESLWYRPNQDPNSFGGNSQSGVGGGRRATTVQTTDRNDLIGGSGVGAGSYSVYSREEEDDDSETTEASSSPRRNERSTLKSTSAASVKTRTPQAARSKAMTKTKRGTKTKTMKGATTAPAKWGASRKPQTKKKPPPRKSAAKPFYPRNSYTNNKKNRTAGRSGSWEAGAGGNPYAGGNCSVWGPGYQHRSSGRSSASVRRQDPDLKHIGGAAISF